LAGELRRLSRWSPAVLALCLILLAIAWPRAEVPPIPVKVAFRAPAPAPSDLCIEEPAPRLAERAAEPVPADEGEPFDSGGPLVLVDDRGVLRVESVRDDGRPEPFATFDVVNCGPTVVLETGAITRWRAHAGVCTVIGWREDGRLATPQQVARVRIETGEESRVRFTFPADRTGSVGVALEWTDLGAEVTDILPGSPAEEAGLAPGDLLLAIDGQSVDELSDEEIASLTTGSEDVAIVLTIGIDGDTGLGGEDIELVREFLPAEE
jgi:hypothetical protein